MGEDRRCREALLSERPKKDVIGAWNCFFRVCIVVDGIVTGFLGKLRSWKTLYNVTVMQGVYELAQQVKEQECGKAGVKIKISGLVEK